MIQIEDLEKRIAALEQRITPAETHTEPRPLLSGAKVGWICKHRNGAYSQLVKYHTVLSLSHPWESSNGILYTVNGSSHHDTAISSNDIISTELLAEVGSAEWAWQMMLLGNKVTCKGMGDYCMGIVNSIAVFYDYKGRRCYPDWNYDKGLWGKYSKGTKRDAERGLCKIYPYQIFEPEPALQANVLGDYEPSPQPKVKVGKFANIKKDDWVEIEDNKKLSQGKVVKLLPCNGFTIRSTGSGHFYDYDVNGNWVHQNGKSEHYKVTRILPRSEVRVSIRLEGTVEKFALQDSFCIRYGEGGGQFSVVDYAHLSPSDAALVRELTEAPKEEK